MCSERRHGLGQKRGIKTNVKDREGVEILGKTGQELIDVLEVRRLWGKVRT